MGMQRTSNVLDVRDVRAALSGLYSTFNLYSTLTIILNTKAEEQFTSVLTLLQLYVLNTKRPEY